MQPKLEVACFNLQSAKTGADAGADRIEFAADYSCGGITPSLADFRELRTYTEIPVFVLIRSRGGNFSYSKDEISEMKRSITEFSGLGANGFVFGCLNEENGIDTRANLILLEAAHPLPCTFHRAFDRAENQIAALESIIDLGFSCILSSGGEKNALAGARRLTELKKEAAGLIEIMAGGGIRAQNISELMKMYDANWYHSACISDSSEQADKQEIVKLKSLLKR